ncbi:AraC family transcriptional regulator [Spirulina subsalsa]|nr:AraC family transcriptional regulator [Spirulina subsalsa]
MNSRERGTGNLDKLRLNVRSQGVGSRESGVGSRENAVVSNRE